MSDLGAPNPRDARNRKRRRGEKKVEDPPHLRARWPPRRPRILSGRERARSRGPAAGKPPYRRSPRARKENPDPQRRQAESSRRRDVSSSAVDQLAARQQPQRNGRRGDGADGAAARAAAPNVGEVIDGKQWQFNAEQIIGNGCSGDDCGNRAAVAIKKVFRATMVAAKPEQSSQSKKCSRTSASRTGNCTS